MREGRKEGGRRLQYVAENQYSTRVGFPSSAPGCENAGGGGGGRGGGGGSVDIDSVMLLVTVNVSTG